MTDEKNHRGGARKGAGRPKGTSKLYAFRADKEVADFIDQQENKTEFLKNCVSKEMEAQNKCKQQADLSSLGVVVPATRVQPVTIPFFDINIVAGFPIPLDNDEKSQDIELVSMLCPHPESTYIIRVEGYSMIDAGIQTGDVVVVDKSNREPTETQIAVCEFNGEYTLKHFVRRGNMGYLVPANPDFPEIPITESDDFSVWGTVTYIIRKAQG